MFIIAVASAISTFSATQLLEAQAVAPFPVGTEAYETWKLQFVSLPSTRSVHQRSYGPIPPFFITFGVGTDQLFAPNDDGSLTIAAFGFTIPFLGLQRSNGWLNNNGNFAFNGPIASFTASVPLIQLNEM